MVRAVDALRRGRGRSAGREGFTLIELLVVMAIMLILTGMITSTIFVFKRIMQGKAAATDIRTFTIGLAAYRRDLGSYPPSDLASWIGSEDNYRNEILHYYLGRRHVKGANYYGPYVKFKTKRLRDNDTDSPMGDGFQEYSDPFGGLYEYGLVTDADGVAVRYEIVAPGPDGRLGGIWDESGSDPDGDPDLVGEFVIKDEGQASDNASFGGKL